MVTIWLTLPPISAVPIGDSLESLPLARSASVEPTIWNLRECARLLVLDVDCGTEGNFALVCRGIFNHGRPAQALLELDDLGLELGLLVLGVVVLGVLGDIPEVTGLLDAISHLAAADRREVLDLFFKLLQPFGRDFRLATHRYQPHLGRQGRTSRP